MARGFAWLSGFGDEAHRLGDARHRLDALDRGEHGVGLDELPEADVGLAFLSGPWLRVLSMMLM